MIKGQKLRELREEQKLTQAEVAHGLGLSAARVSTIESGRRGPVSPDTAARYLRQIFPGENVQIHTHVRAFVGDRLVIEEGEKA